MTIRRPHQGSALATFLSKEMLKLRHSKSQIEIATEAGFANPNMISMLKNGATRLPLDRVPALAKALGCDPRYLFRLALEQGGNETTKIAVDEIFGAIVTENEVIWLNELRSASAGTNPNLTARARAAIRGIFGK